MKNVIITGADGFVGSYTTQYFLQQGCHVLAIGRKAQPVRLVPDENLTWLQWDISNIASIAEVIPAGVYDSFLHFAWEGSAGAQRTDCALQMANALAAAECVKVAKKLGCSRFAGAGSIMEYETEAVIHAQGAKPGMGYVYGMGKQVAHGLCKAVAAEVGIDFLWPMITNAYGPGETSPRFVNTTLQKVINGQPLQFTAATQNYDFVYVTDVAKAFYLVAKRGKPFHEYMIGSGNARPLKEFIREMVAACAPGAMLQFGEIPFTGVNLSLEIFDTGALEIDCGFRAEVSFGAGTKQTLQWLRGQQDVL